MLYITYIDVYIDIYYAEINEFRGEGYISNDDTYLWDLKRYYSMSLFFNRILYHHKTEQH